MCLFTCINILKVMILIQVSRALPGFHSLANHHFSTPVLPTYTVTLYEPPSPPLINSVPKQTSFHSVALDLEWNTNCRVKDLDCVPCLVAQSVVSDSLCPHGL